MEISPHFDQFCLRDWCHGEYRKPEGMRETPLCPSILCFWRSPGQPTQWLFGTRAEKGTCKLVSFMNLLGTDFHSIR